MTVIAPLSFVPEAVIFDMDGLMLDSERASIECRRRAASDLEQQIEPDYWMQMVGMSDTACHALLAARIGAVSAAALLARSDALYDAVVTMGVPHRPGIITLLEWLCVRGIPCAVGTSTRRPLALRKLNAAGLLWRFDAVCTASDVAHAKPAPDIYVLAAHTLGIVPARCLVVEDSPIGVRAALAAGMTPIQVPDLLMPDAQVRALGHRIVASLIEVQRLLEVCFDV
ncbi:HAD family phosphatase [Xylella taiwanensis]|uniref:HAD family phosphatase n=1 Tax=Xylella taiwanensis TaxID=1444770 RepID=Z9JJV2_9GAMM|nr:HAD family phosphatase [Xylella taiwanensis]AXI83004.1 hydrolase [Xylella taiwanensis]EWS78454.1 hydrolase [Xylella taiwanensis]MCD8456029.1 HAD family phosphatase [Xylella taiwanensis]MCD8458433.1 HAD family phosphatase [Xylella taiwanensis]MCD8460569.1 HAD family phosphatase [Xylella taiwanensis]